MRGLMRSLRALLVLCACAPALVAAKSACDEEVAASRSHTPVHFMILAGRDGVFYDRSGPAFVILMKAGADAYDVGAIGIYAGEGKQPVFGPVPAAIYEKFMRDTQGA